MTKNPQKNRSLNGDLLNFFIGMVYFRCLLVNSHVQAVENMCGQGGRGCFRLSYEQPKFTLFSKKTVNAVSQKTDTVAIFKI